MMVNQNEFFSKLGMSSNLNIRKRVKESIEHIVGTNLTDLVLAYIEIRLKLDGRGTVQLLQIAERDFGISRYRLWKVFQTTLGALGWRLIEHCENTCTECHLNWKSLVVVLERGQFVPICPNCSHRAVEIHNVAEVPHWMTEKNFFKCSKCKKATDYYIVESDPFSKDLVRAICPQCLASFHYLSVPPDVKKILETVLMSNFNSVLYEIQNTLAIPTDVIELVRYLLDGVDLMPFPLFNIFAAIEIAKILLMRRETTVWRDYLRKKIELVQFDKKWWMNRILQSRTIRIVKDRIAICLCGHPNVFMREKERIRCPRCLTFLNFDERFTSFSEVDLLATSSVHRDDSDESGHPVHHSGN